MPVAWDEFEPVAEAHHDTDWGQFEPVKPKEIPLPTFQTPSAEEMFGPGLRQQTPGERLRLSSVATRLLGPPMPTGRGGAQEIGVLPVLASAPMPFLPGPETVAGKALLSYFVSQFALKQPEIVPAIKDAYDKKDWETLKNLVGEEAFGAAFAGIAGHGVIGVKPGVTPRIPVIDVESQVRPAEGEPLTPGQRLTVPGPITGADLATPRGAQPPPPPIVERVSPGEAARQAQAMTRTATAAFEPPRLPKPVVPEGPTAAPAPVPEAVLPPELGSFDDFVSDLKKRGSGQETRAQIQVMFPGVTISQEAAGDLARAAFGDKWMPGGKPAAPEAPPEKGPSEREVSAPSPVPPVIGLPPVGVPTQQAQAGTALGGGQGQEGQAPVQAEAPVELKPENFPPPAKKTSQFIRIQTADGKTVPAYYEGGYMDLPDSPYHGKPWVSYLTPDGKWTTGLLHQGDTVLDKIPTFDEWKAGQQKTPAPAPVPPPIEPPATPPVSPPAPAPSPPVSPGATKPPETATKRPESESEASIPATLKAADEIAEFLKFGQPLSKTFAHDIIAKHHGGTMAEGKFTSKDQSDIIEMAVNKFLNSDPALFDPSKGDPAYAISRILVLKELLERLPTQTTRTGETDKMQQFSTVPTEAYAANWVAKVNPNDDVLEPSAGLAGLGVFAKNAGAHVTANELSPRRRAMLEQTGLADVVLGFNAEMLHALMVPGINSGTLRQPTLVVMNPPFSRAAMSDIHRTSIGAKHVEEALKLLKPGGRLVAIVGEGMAMGKPTFVPWWGKIAKTYNIRANVTVSGEEYRKYGTTFDNQLIVIDKTGPTTDLGKVVTGKAEKVEDLIPMLEGVRNDRPPIEPAPAQPSGPSPTAPGGPPPSLGAPPTPAPTGGPGPGRPGPPTSGGQRPAPQGGTGLGTVPPTPTQRPTGPPRPSGPPTGPQPAPPAPVGPPSGLPAPAAGPAISVEHKPPTERKLSETGIFTPYVPVKVHVPGTPPHPAPLVESTSMAAVEPVDPTYKPSLNKEAVAFLSDEQMENIIYAGQAHEKFLPTGERQGYFIGDGTGVGKGAEISGIFQDNANKGRVKGLWVSAKQDLLKAAQRDFKSVGSDPKDLIDFRKSGGKMLPGAKSGIGFITYTSLTNNFEGLVPPDPNAPVGAAAELQASTDPQKPSRIRLFHQWVGGKDFDGVIAFDEAHYAGNAVDIRGSRGVEKASERGKMVVALQALFPKARIVYVSATGATDVANLSYADRLGIWGPGTPFPNKLAFVNTISASGLSAMEIVARDLKATGKYLARSLSFAGIRQDPLPHKLSPDQIAIYDEVSRAWQKVLESINSSMAQTGMANAGRARGSITGKFWGAELRFYNQILTAMQMPTIIDQIRKSLDAGNAPVIQLVNTNEATLDRELAKRGAEADEGDTDWLEDLDLTPKQILIEYVDAHYPTQLYAQETDAQGNTSWKPQFNPDGSPVESPEAAAEKQRLMDQLRLMRAPQNPIEMILDTFGEENVAEITGRSQRVVKKLQADGTRKEVREPRSHSMRAVEHQEFNDDKRRILIFSEAGGTGFDYHSSRTFVNQRPRDHIGAQMGWRADTAIQGAGRTNRTNQAHPPHYLMPSTDIPGHKRFIATMMRRMSEMGALTGGERRAAVQEMFKESDDLENAYAHAAVLQFFRRLFAHEYPDINFDALSKKMGFTYQYLDPATGEIEEINTLVDRDSGQLNISKLPAVHKFLNRVLILEKAEQDKVFKEFDDLRETIIDNAKADGSFDPGTQSLRALAIRKVSDEAVYHDPNSTAKTRLVTIEHDQPVKVIPWEDIKTIAPSQGVSQYVKNLKNGRVFALKEGPPRTLDNGSVVDTWRRISPTGYDILTRSSVVTEAYYGQKPNYEIIEPADAKELWDEQASKAPKVKTHKDTYVVGTFLPIWDRLRLPNPRIWRFTTDTGENILGAHVPAQAVEALRDRLGAGGEKVTPKILFDRVMDGGQSVELANGWIVKRSKVQGEFRIEVKGVEFNQMQEFEKFIGGYMERIAFEPRFFIPTDEDAALVSLEKVLQKSPVVSKKAPPGTSAGPAIGGPPAYSGIPIPLTVEQMREYAQDLSQAGNMAREFWRGFAMKQAPKITDADRETGEAAVKYAAAPLVAREKGLIFAGKVLAGVTDPKFDIKLGTGISEDNLRDLKQRNLDLVYEVEHRDELIEQARAEIEGYADDAREGDAMAKAIIRELRQRIARLSEYTDEDAERFQNLADNTFTFIGKPGSPFQTEQAYRDFMTSAEARTIRERHQDLWREQKDPLFRMASDLDPDAALETRGLDYGARINLKPVFEQREATGTTVGTAPRSIFIKQTATLKKKNPFAIRAEGQAPAYESSYTELIAHGFEREYPIAKQHEFIRKLIESGNASLSERESPPGLLIKGEPTKGYLQKLRPWRGRFLQVPRKLATEYEAITGLSPAARIPIYTGIGKLLTRLSITGLAEGTTHVANLLSESFTGLGPTANPMINALLKVMGRADLIYRLPRVLIRGFASNREEMMELAEIGATKQAYRGTLGWFLNNIDRGSRLVMADIYRGMAEAGWVEDTETGLREFVNQLGNYNKKLQPTFIRWLRDTHVQPFATAMQTFNTQGLRRLLLAPGVTGTSARAKLALHADIAAGLMGFAVLVAFLNYLLSGKAEGPKGTKLGAVGWMGKDGKLQQLDLGLLTGWTRGARITGVQAFVESKRAGLPSSSALMAATRSVGNTALSEVTGPLNRFATVSLTGKRPGVPMVQEAQVLPPQDEFSTLRSQLAENTATALRQSSPLVDAIASFQEGKPLSEIAQRQASRFTPRAGLSQETIENLPRIVKASEINAYADALGKQARKVPITERWKFVSDRMTQDGLSPELRGRAVVEMRKKGIFRYQ